MIRILTVGAGMLLAQGAFGQAATVEVNVTALAAGALDHAAKARHAAMARSREIALRHVDQALQTAREAETAARGAGLERDGRVVIPLQTEVEIEATHRPRRAGADVTSRVEDVTGGVTHASVDIAMARQHLEAARTALDRNDYSAAEASLASVEYSVQTIAARDDMPLVRARQNLEVARARARDGKPGAAREPLREAGRALREYEWIVPSPWAAEVTALRAEVEAYSRRVGRDRERAPERIGQFIDKMNRWPVMAAD